MRFEIDQQDLVHLVHDTRRRFDRARMGLVFSLSVLAVGMAVAGFQLYRAASLMISAAPALNLAGLARAYRTTPESFHSELIWLGAVALFGFLGAVILRARKKREVARKSEILNHPLTAGQFDYTVALDQIIIRGPLAVKKISWSNIDRVERKKSSIIFWRKDGSYDFIPRNVLPKEDYYEQLIAKHGPNIGNACPFEQANHATPLSVSYEATRADSDEYLQRYFRDCDGRANVLRRLCQWPAWAPILFIIFLMLAASSANAAFRAEHILFAGVSLAFALAAIFVLNANYFRGPGFPFRKDKSWPFAQADLATVTLSKNGVHYTRHGADELIQWGAFDRYIETRLYGYLVIAPKTVIALPKRAFLSKPHFVRFTAYARKAIAEAKHARSEAKHGRMMRAVGNKQEKPSATKPAPATAPKLPVANSTKKAAAQQLKPRLQKPPAVKPDEPPAIQTPPVNTRTAAQQAVRKKTAAQ